MTDMKVHVTDFFWPESINQSTVNGWIFLRPELVYGLYLLAFLLFTGAFFLFKRTYPPVIAARRSIIFTFIAVALVYAIAHEAIWSHWLGADITSFFGKDTPSRQIALNGEFYKFIAHCKEHIGSDTYTLYPDATSVPELHFKSMSLQYYLLPARKKNEGKYLIVLSDGIVYLNEGSSLLYTGDRTKKYINICARQGDEAFLLRVDNK